MPTRSDFSNFVPLGCGLFTDRVRTYRTARFKWDITSSDSFPLQEVIILTLHFVWIFHFLMIRTKCPFQCTVEQSAKGEIKSCIPFMNENCLAAITTLLLSLCVHADLDLLHCTDLHHQLFFPYRFKMFEVYYVLDLVKCMMCVYGCRGRGGGLKGQNSIKQESIRASNTLMFTHTHTGMRTC